MNCTNCGAKLEDSAKFCGVCGTPAQVNAPPPQEPVYSAPAYEPPPQEPVYAAPAYAPPPQEQAYPAPAYAPPPQEPVYAAPAYAPPPQEQAYAAPIYEQPPLDPSYPAPAYAPPPQEQAYAAPIYEQPPLDPSYPAPAYAPPPQEQAYSQPQYAPPPYGGPPPGATPGAAAGGRKKGINLKILIPVAAAVLLLAVFAGLWFFTDIFTGGSGGGKTDTTEPPPRTETTPDSPTPTRPEPPSPEPPAPGVREGYYRLVSFEMEGVDMLELYEALGLSIDSIYMEVRSGGIIVMVVEGESMEGTYTVSGNKITLLATETGESRDGIIEDGKITFDMDEGALMGFEWDPTFVPPPINDYEPWLDPYLEVLSEGGNQISEAGFYRFIPSQPGIWEFRTTNSGDSDPMLRIYDNYGDELAFNDDGDDGYDAFIAIFVSDMVVVEVAFWDGNTSTTLEIFPEGASSAHGMVVEGFIPSGGGIVAIYETQTLEFTTDRAGFWVFYTTNNEGCDPFLTLYNRYGDGYADDDDGMGDYNAMLIVFIEEGIPGSIEAGFAEGSIEGYYELVVKAPETLPDGGGIFVVEAPQAFAFTPDRSGTWVFSTSENGGGDPFIQVFDESGDMWEDDDGGDGFNAFLSVELIAGERYHINASFATLGPTTYTLTVSYAT